MYIIATVPPIEDMAPCFRYVNVAYLDMDDHKLVEFAKVIPDAPPQELRRETTIRARRI